MRNVFIAATLACATIASAADKRPVTLPGANPDLPFSSAVWTGDFLYTSGSLGGVPGEGYSADGWSLLATYLRREITLDDAVGRSSDPDEFRNLLTNAQSHPQGPGRKA